MFVLFENPAGIALFKYLGDHCFAENFQNTVIDVKDFELVAFNKYDDVAEAVSVTSDILKYKIPKNLSNFLKRFVGEKEVLGVCDPKFGCLIREKCGISCLYNQAVLELTREIRSRIKSLISSTDYLSINQMSIGLSHSLSRHKLKLSPNKASIMVIQAINLVDNLDKELNTFSMRIREWYGWHFPEMTKIITENLDYAKVVRVIGVRENVMSPDLAAILPPNTLKDLREASFISLGTEISIEDLNNIKQLCDLVISLSDYRTNLYEYLKIRINQVAPNLSVLVGELVGARLIAHAGSIINLAKYPASTIQILGAEKALFRALKTKKCTPKYGLIYHASLVGKSSQKLRGKISRILAAKCSLSIRVDALDDFTDAHIGIDGRAKVESRLRQLEINNFKSVSKKYKSSARLSTSELQRRLF